MCAKCIFFYKQKTAYAIRLSLVGSEMCIRTSTHTDARVHARARAYTTTHTTAVSYTHLTLPTNREVEIAVVAEAFKKNNREGTLP